MFVGLRGFPRSAGRLAEVVALAALGSVIVGAVRDFPPPGGFRWSSWLSGYTLPFALLMGVVARLPLPQSRPSAPSTATPATWILWPWLATRLPMLLVTLYLAPRYPAQWPEMPWLAGFFRWDCSYYNSIALTGYELIPGQMCNMAFFPLYPLLLKATAWIGLESMQPQQAATAAGLAVNNLLFPLGLLGLLRWVEAASDAATARRAVWLCCASPFSFFANVPYTEALFFSLTAWTLYFVKIDRPYPAFLLGGLAAVTRPPGTFFAAAVGLEYLWRQRRQPGRWAPVALLGVPFLAFTLFQYQKFGHPFAFTIAQKGWGSFIGELWVEIDWYRRNEGAFNFLTVHLNFLLLALSFLTVHLVAWAVSPWQGIYVLGGLALISLRTMNSMGRYVCYTVPFYLPWAQLLRGPACLLVCALSLVLQFLMLYGFYTGRWVN